MKEKGYIFAIKKFAVHDGPGIRTTVFLSGCPLRCWWCHNPEGYELRNSSPNGVMEGHDSLSNPREKNLKSREVSVDEVIREVDKDRIFYDQSGGGVTFSGGEPFFQPDFLEALLHSCQKRNIHTAVDTSGYISHTTLKKILPLVDLLLFDLKFPDDNLAMKYTGVSAKNIVTNLRYLINNYNHGIRIRIRFPLIPGITDTEPNVTGIIALLKELGKIEHLDILPYHNTGADKFSHLGIVYKMAKTKIPNSTYIKKICSQFERQGFKVDIGG